VNEYSGMKFEDDCFLGCVGKSDHLMKEAVKKSETSVNFYEATRRNIPEDIHLQAYLLT
jgi:hypothetical protein